MATNSSLRQRALQQSSLATAKAKSSYQRTPLVAKSASSSTSPSSASTNAAATAAINASYDSRNPLKKFGKFYTRNFESRPMPTLMVTNSVLNAVGDAAAQSIPFILGASGVPLVWDFERTFRFAFFGFALGPLIGTWNKFLEHRFPIRPVPPVAGEEPPELTPDIMEKIQAHAKKEGYDVKLERGVNNKETPEGIKAEVAAVDSTQGQADKVDLWAVGKRTLADQLFMAPIGLAIFLSSMSILEGLEWHEIVQRYQEMYLPLLFANWKVWPLVQLINFRFLPLRYRVPFTGAIGILWTTFISFSVAAGGGGK